MEVRKLILMLMLIPASLQAQENPERYIHKGLVCLRGSIAYGTLFDLKTNHVYLVGGLEYFTSDKISISGDTYFYVNAVDSYTAFTADHSLFFGAMFHLPVKGHSNVYFGFQPGANLAQAVNPCMGQPCPEIVYPEEPELTLSPLASVVAGYRFFGTKFFHLNVDTRYITGRFMDNYNSASLSEWRISFSLGLNLF